MRARGAPAALALALVACGVESRRAPDTSETTEPGSTAALPVPRAGGDAVGARIEDAWLERWIGARVPLSGAGAARATLLRWWTDTCPSCEASLPAVEELRTRYASRGLATVAVYHPKPPRFESDAAVRAAAAERGYHGPLAVDGDWSALARFWLDTGDRTATSASFLVDATGAIRFVHPGPEFHQVEGETDADHATCASDFRDLERAIEALLDA